MLKNNKKTLIKNKSTNLPYDKEFKIKKLKFLILIVNKYQGDY